MNNPENVVGIVKMILEENEQSRNSDSYLYLKVLEYLDKVNDTMFCRIPVRILLTRMNEYKIPGFETVRRTRQKIQAKHPELAACRKVEGFRDANERVFREFAGSDLQC